METKDLLEQEKKSHKLNKQEEKEAKSLQAQSSKALKKRESRYQKLRKLAKKRKAKKELKKMMAPIKAEKRARREYYRSLSNPPVRPVLEEIGNALKGASVGLDLTKTPAQFLTTIIDGVNEIMADGEDIWYTDSTGVKVPNNLTTYNPDNEMKISQVDSASTAIQATNFDFVIAFAPSATLLEDLGTMKVVCKTSTHFADDYKPSTWAVNIDWLEKNEETFKKVMRGLVKGMNFRRDNPEETCKDIEEITAGSVMAEGLATDIAIWLGDQEQIDLYDDGKMVEYAQNILDNDRAGANADKVSANASVEKNADFSYIYEAAKAVLAE